jgi:transposase-like protein
LSTIESLHEAAEETALPTEQVPAQTAPPAQPEEISPERAARRRLTPEQQREIARLYAEGALPTSEIRKRFGIGESSLYRIVQREGVPLRGRAAAAPGPARAPATDSGRRAAPTDGGAQARAGQPRAAATAAPAGPSRRGGRGRVGRAPSSASGGAASPGAGGRGQFRIEFQAERVIQARDIREALRQAESFGAIEVTAVTRED